MQQIKSKVLKSLAPKVNKTSSIVIWVENSEIIFFKFKTACPKI